MRTIREAIAKGSMEIVCNNGTRIQLHDRFRDGSQAFGRIKNIDGKPVFRWIFFTVHKSKKTNLSSISHRCEFDPDYYCYFQENDYIAREKEVNEFIHDNGGIDEYRTMYWVNQYDY